MSQSKETARPRRGIRFRLLVSVNAVAAVALATLLFLDYRREIREHVTLIRGGLEAEAKTLLPALRRLAEDGPAAVQQHVDVVCSLMRESTSPGHHIAVVWGGQSFQARAHGRESPEMLRAMARAAVAESGAPADGEIIVGRQSDGRMTVYVSETVSNVLSRARMRALQRAAVLGGLIVAAGLAVNLILVRLVVRPIRELAGTVREIGAGNLGARAPDSKTAEFSILASEINQMSSALLRNGELRRLEMNKAREIQERLCEIPEDVPGMSVARLYRPAAEVAGDFYNLLPLSDGTWLLCIADVMGHGIPAAMGAAILKAVLGAAAENLVDPGRILSFVNERLCQVSLPGDFASAALVRWDPERSKLEYAGAGHEAGIFRAPDGAVWQLDSTGMVLGIRDEAAWETKSFPVPVGAQLLLTTDGVSETLSPDGELFGTDRVANLLRECGSGSPADTLRQVEDALHGHRVSGRQTDDITMLLARFTGENEKTQ